ncbi:hypothetical protein GCM10027273_06070 [Nocardioides pakistanensis]
MGMRPTPPARLVLAGLALSTGLTACSAGGEAGSPATHAPDTPAFDSRADAASAAQALVAYAEGTATEVPWASEVSYRIAGEQVARFAADLADRRSTWDGCPRASSTYEGRDCPVSPLRTITLLVRDGGEVTFDSEPPRIVGCSRYQDAAARSAETIWIRPDETHRDCFSDFAVALSLDGSGRVAAVDLTLSGP